MRSRLAVLCMFVLAACDEVFDLVEVTSVGDGGVDAAVDLGLVGWFTMDGLDGNLVIDAAGNHDGLCTAQRCPSPIPGVVDGALLFDGVDDIVQLAPSTDFDASRPFTIALWLRQDRAVSEWACAVVKLYGPAGTIANSWEICTYNGEIGFWIGDPLFGQQIPYGEWIHVTGVWDGTSRILYVDGLESARASQPSAGFDSGRVLIGADIDSGTPQWFWPGALDDLRIYERALPDFEIVELASARE